MKKSMLKVARAKHYLLISNNKVISDNGDVMVSIPLHTNTAHEPFSVCSKTFKALVKAKSTFEIIDNNLLVDGIPCPRTKKQMIQKGAFGDFSESQLIQFDFRSIAYAMANSNNRFSVLTGILFDIDGTLAASDIHRIAWGETEYKSEEPFILHSEAVKVLESFKGNTFEISTSTYYMRILCDGVEIVGRKINGQFPRYKPIIEETDLPNYIEIGNLYDVVKSVLPILNQETLSIILTTSLGGSLQVGVRKNKGDEFQFFETSGTMQIGFILLNAKYLLELIQHGGSIIEYKDEFVPVRSGAGLLMPLLKAK